jgi:type IV secretion system protein VirD4
MNWIFMAAVNAATHAITRAGKYTVWSIGLYLWAAASTIKDGYAVYQPDPSVELPFMSARLLLLLEAIFWHGPPVGRIIHDLFFGSVRPEAGEAVLVAGLGRLIGTWALFLLWFAAFVALCVMVLRIIQETAPKLPKILEPQGGRFARRGDVAAMISPSKSVFGYYRGNPLILHTDKHVLIIASTRSGKGVLLIIPHLLRYRGSAFVLDTKGENARATGRHRGSLNDFVHYLDPFGISGKLQSRFNPMSRFNSKSMEGASKALAEAFFTTRERDHWSTSGQQLLALFIMYVFASDIFPQSMKDLITVRRLLLSSALEALREMKKSKLSDGLIASLASSFLNTPVGERGSIISAAQRETEILDNPYIAACLAATGDTPEVDFLVWHEKTMTVYLCLSAPKFPVFNRLLRLVLTSALDEMTDKLNPPSLPICFLLDELATLGHFQPVEDAIGLAAGYGVQFYSVFQDSAQMRDLYQGRWASFIGNSGIRAVFNLDDYDTAHYWSDFLGGHTTQTISHSHDSHGIIQSRTSGETIQPLLSAEELMRRYTAEKMLILPQGGHPIEADRVPYFADPSLAGLWDDPRGPLPAPEIASPPPEMIA